MAAASSAVGTAGPRLAWQHLERHQHALNNQAAENPTRASAELVLEEKRHSFPLAKEEDSFDNDSSSNVFITFSEPFPPCYISPKTARDERKQCLQKQVTL